ncbi:MAG TPA: hypothetical protein VGE35_02660 [Candidatus Paceibacterota bacterium]
MGTNKPYKQLGEREMSLAAEARFKARLAAGQRQAFRMARIRCGVYALASLVACVGSAISISSALSESGAYEFIALAFQDAAALAYSKELFLSVAGSLPVLGVASLVGAAAFSAITLPRFVRMSPSALSA